jgi:hypothetical protein
MVGYLRYYLRADTWVRPYNKIGHFRLMDKKGQAWGPARFFA